MSKKVKNNISTIIKKQQKSKANNQNSVRKSKKMESKDPKTDKKDSEPQPAEGTKIDNQADISPQEEPALNLGERMPLKNSKTVKFKTKEQSILKKEPDQEQGSSKKGPTKTETPKDGIIKKVKRKPKLYTKDKSTSTDGVVDHILELTWLDSSLCIHKDGDIPHQVIESAAEIKKEVESTTGSIKYKLPWIFLLLSMLTLLGVCIFLCDREEYYAVAVAIGVFLVANKFVYSIRSSTVRQLQRSVSEKVSKFKNSLNKDHGFSVQFNLDFSMRMNRKGQFISLNRVFDFWISFRKREIINSEALPTAVYHEEKIMEKTAKETSTGRMEHPLVHGTTGGKGKDRKRNSIFDSTHQEGNKGESESRRLIGEDVESGRRLDQMNSASPSKIIKTDDLNIQAVVEEGGNSRLQVDEEENAGANAGETALEFKSEFGMPNDEMWELSHQPETINLTINGQDLICFPSKYKIRQPHHPGFGPSFYVDEDEDEE